MKHSKSNQGKMRSMCIIASTALFLFVPRLSVAQSAYPGFWTRVSLPQFFHILDFGFADTLNGVLEANDGTLGFTTDGGKTWASAGKPADGIASKPFIGMVSCTGPQKAIIATSECSLIALDGDSVTFTQCQGELPSDDSWTPLAQKMYDSLYGFRFVQVLDRSNSPLDTVRFLVTHDGWNTYQTFGDSLVGTELATGADGGETEIDGATLVDSNEVWLGINNTIYRTTNAGLTWDTFQPQAETADSNLNPQWYNFIVNPQTKEVYAKSAIAPIDYAYSSDYGKTWELDSTFKGRMSRLSVTAPHTLWAIIGRHTSAKPPIDLKQNLPTYFSKVLAYSSDNGVSWSLDSTTFAGDSEMLEMHWIDSRHGWIASYVDYNGPSGMWYYDAGTSGVESLVDIKYAAIRVYPDPATDQLNLDIVEPDLEIYDPLGRRYSVPINGNSLDISSLPSGLYFLYDGFAVRAKFVKE